MDQPGVALVQLAADSARRAVGVLERLGLYFRTVVLVLLVRNPVHLEQPEQIKPQNVPCQNYRLNRPLKPPVIADISKKQNFAIILPN